ncbi:MAG: sugar phosphate nucleotidyltransferase [Lentimicrobiaceae bacterium]|jgi:dTDP-glucose pyrophosphorylase
MKPTLLVLAAGMGSRYGSLKQIDPVGPSGETIIDYSIYDAIRAGFGKVVFIIRKSFEQDFKDIFISKLQPYIPVEYVFQEIENVPDGLTVSPERTKPWGTAHAILMAKDVIHEPFAVINGDDFYGSGAFQTMADYLNALTTTTQTQYSLVGYKVGNTLSDHGTVSRGVCQEDKNGFLISVTERTNIQYFNEGIAYQDGDDSLVFLNPETPVSMNFWGFTPEYFKQTEAMFIDFVKANSDSLKAEFYIPTAIDNLINSASARVKVLRSDAKWFGVTYKEDKPLVIEKLAQLIKAGVYPAKLWK